MSTIWDAADLFCYNVIDGGAVGNGTTNDAPAIQALVNTAAANTNGGTVIFTAPSTAYRFSTAVTVPVNVAVVCFQGAKISIDAGHTFTCNGPFSANPSTVFTGLGNVAFGDGSVEVLYPQWWGAVGDGSHDDTTALQSCLSAVPADAARGLSVMLLPGSYKVTTGLTVSATQNLNIIGEGGFASKLVWAGGNSATVLSILSTTAHLVGSMDLTGFRIQNINASTGLTGVEINTQVPGESDRNLIRLSQLLLMDCHINLALNGGIEECIVESCGFLGGDYGILQTPSTSSIQSLQVRGCNFYGLTTWAVYAASGTGIVLSGNLVDASDSGLTTASGFMLDNIGGAVVECNQFGMLHNTGYSAVYVGKNAIVSPYNSGCVIQGNQFLSAIGITVDYAKATSILSNTFFQTNVAIAVTANSDNTFIGPQVFGTGVVTKVSAADYTGITILDDAIGSRVPAVVGISHTTTPANNLRGTKTFASSGTASVTFATAEPDASYFVVISGSAAETFYVTSKGTGGFTLNSSNASSASTVDWVLVR